jgi:hypothetical protein
VNTTLFVLPLQFGRCALVIGRAGDGPSGSADRISQATGPTGGWVGPALLALRSVFVHERALRPAGGGATRSLADSSLRTGSRRRH